MSHLGVWFMILAIALSVTLHEFGHFSTARLFGLKVPQFFIGFGPTLWSFKRGETEYGVKALPLGGFVRIVGQTSFEEIAPEDQGREMWRQPAWRRAVVMVAGSTMHFLIGIVILVGLYLFVGQQEYGPGTTIGQVSACVDDTCTSSSPPSPAVAAGLKHNDTILNINGTAINKWDQVTELIRSNPVGRAMQFTVLRKGQTLHLTATPVQRDRASITDPKKTVNVGVLGIGLKAVTHHFGPLRAVAQGGNDFWQVTNGTYHAVISLPSKVPALFHAHQKRTGDGLIGIVGAAKAGGEAIHRGLPDFFALVASINISIGLFNLLPFLPLDGGHLAVIGVEKARSFWARRFRRPDPGRIDLLKLQAPTLLFLGSIGILSLALVYQDLFNPIPNPY